MTLKFGNLLAMVRKPHYAGAGVFRSDEDLEFIPDLTLNFTTQVASETADGVTTEFTFEGIPRYVWLNGQWRRQNVGYTLNGTVVTFIDEIGAPFAPLAGSTVEALV